MLLGGEICLNVVTQYKKHDFVILQNNMVDDRVVEGPISHHSMTHLTGKVLECKHMK